MMPEPKEININAFVGASPSGTFSLVIQLDGFRDHELATRCGEALLGLIYENLRQNAPTTEVEQ
ncbi:MAG: hypothetical protein C4523_02405 [Myxococcales bacterium]|nr:MAG: hypothetical protein C4523_02405 [Myxococcales bacterium]